MIPKQPNLTFFIPFCNNRPKGSSEQSCFPSYEPYRPPAHREARRTQRGGIQNPRQKTPLVQRGEGIPRCPVRSFSSPESPNLKALL